MAIRSITMALRCWNSVAKAGSTRTVSTPLDRLTGAVRRASCGPMISRHSRISADSRKPRFRSNGRTASSAALASDRPPRRGGS